jgi:hypothetical protein
MALAKIRGQDRRLHSLAVSVGGNRPQRPASASEKGPFSCLGCRLRHCPLPQNETDLAGVCQDTRCGGLGKTGRESQAGVACLGGLGLLGAAGLALRQGESRANKEAWIKHDLPLIGENKACIEEDILRTVCH